MLRISAQEYHGSPALSRSYLWNVYNRSVSYAEWKRENPDESSSALILGSAIHTLILEPQLFDRQYRVIEDLNRRTNAGKAKIEDLVSQGLTVLNGEEFAQLQGMKRALQAHPLAKRLLDPASGESELSFFWEDPQTGLPCKCRPDKLRMDGLVIDLKSTQDAGSMFSRKAFEYGYHMQAGMYLDGIRANGIDAEAFIFIAVESEPPHDVVVWRAHQETVFLGQAAYKTALDKVLDAQKCGDCPGYSSEVQVLFPPRWMKKESVI